jgi:hypothetical protein
MTFVENDASLPRSIAGRLKLPMKRVCYASLSRLGGAFRMHETTLRYNEPLLREAVRYFFVQTLLRQFGVKFFVFMGFLFPFAGWLLYIHEPGWGLGFLVASLVFMCALLASIYVAHFRNTIGKFRRMRSPEATFGYDEEHIYLTSEFGSATMPWSAITEVWRHDTFWLVFFSPAQFMTLPLDCLDEATQEFINRKVGPSYWPSNPFIA